MKAGQSQQRRQPAQRDAYEDEQLEEPERVLDTDPCLEHRAVQDKGYGDAEYTSESRCCGRWRL